MAADYSICLGTTGWGVWHSPDAGKSWIRHRAPFPLNGRIQALVAHPMVWAGVEIDGVFRSLDGGDTWTHLETGLYDPDIHAVTIAATQPKRIYASTAREMFVSDNLGDTW